MIESALLTSPPATDAPVVLSVRGLSAPDDSFRNLSFDVRGGLLMRQMHHWAAMLFVASMIVHGHQYPLPVGISPR